MIHIEQQSARRDASDIIAEQTLPNYTRRGITAAGSRYTAPELFKEDLEERVEL